MSDLLELSQRFQHEHETTTTAERRKERGQFFTPPDVARFMAGLLSPPADSLSLLDPGAGVGTLAAAVCERVVRLRRPRSLQLCLYETDAEVLPLLRRNMDHCQRALAEAGHTLRYTVCEEDFPIAHESLADGPTLFSSKDPKRFDAVIMNPPYFKIHRSTNYAQLMKRLEQGQPNIYALFMAVAAALLRPGGELVAITPRSFCNGLYFKSFRRWFLDRMSLDHIHLFGSRSDTFRESRVLQENVITLSRKQSQAGTVNLTTSRGRCELDDLPHVTLPKAEVIDDRHGELFVRIPESVEQRSIVRLVDRWEKTFAERGLRVSTGPVVAFRAREFILPTTSDSSTAPYILVNGVLPFETRWPLGNGKPSGFRICEASRSLLLPSKNYVLLRRFSAKEDRRRLTASCFLAHSFSDFTYVAIENHLNYLYHQDRSLSDNEVFGIAALLNSRLLDLYFRALSGNTQVNATELRTIPFPDLTSLALLGRRVLDLHTLAPAHTEEVVLDAFSVDGSIRRYLTEEAR